MLGEFFCVLRLALTNGLKISHTKLVYFYFPAARALLLKCFSQGDRMKKPVLHAAVLGDVAPTIHKLQKKKLSPTS